MTTLREAAEALLTRYVELVNSGDCGFWDPEKVEEVKSLRAALSASPSPVDSRDALIERLVKALEPFARAGDNGRGSALPDDAPLAIVNANMPDLPAWLSKVRGVITQGNIREARAALAAKEQQP